MSIAESVIGIADKVLGKFIPDKTLRDQLRHEMKMAFHEANLAQIELNKEEAKSSSLFVSGWRPFVGWTCGVALAYHFILEPFIKFIVVINGVDVELPTFDFSQLSSILMGMLGLGGLRTYEKMKKVERNNV